MKRAERRAVERIHAASRQLLNAKGYAETYVARVELTNAMNELLRLSFAALERARTSA